MEQHARTLARLGCKEGVPSLKQLCGLQLHVSGVRYGRLKQLKHLEDVCTFVQAVSKQVEFGSRLSGAQRAALEGPPASMTPLQRAVAVKAAEVKALAAVAAVAAAVARVAAARRVCGHCGWFGGQQLTCSGCKKECCQECSKESYTLRS